MKTHIVQIILIGKRQIRRIMKLLRSFVEMQIYRLLSITNCDKIMEKIFELINSWKEKNTKGVFNKIVKITSKRLDYLSSLCYKYKYLNVFSGISWCDWWELEDISEITDENIEFYARHVYEGEYDTIIVPIHWFTISDEEFLNEIRDREIKRIDISIDKKQKIIDNLYNKKVELENYIF
jgi:hypothetical protein